MAQMLLLIRNHEVRSRQSSASVDVKEVILRHALADHHFDPLIGSKGLQRKSTVPVLSDRCFELKQPTPHALNGMVCRSRSRSMQALSCDMSHGLPGPLIIDCWRRAHRVAICNCREMLRMRVKPCKLESTGWVLHLLEMPCTVARRFC